MSHHHHEDDTYFLDQVSMVAISGTFGAICLALYFIRSDMLFLLLGTQFHPFVLASGIALVLLAVVRAGMLWNLAGAHPGGSAEHTFAADDLSHSHSHGAGGHDHGHSHSHGEDREHSHSHSHSHADPHEVEAVAQSRAFGHTPALTVAPAHSHSHGGNHADHDHGWAPWRYVVLLIPIFLFLLGLPNKGPSIDTHTLRTIDTSRDAEEEAVMTARLVGYSSEEFTALSLLAARHAEDAAAANVMYKNVKELEALATNEEDRTWWKGKTIQVKGQYAPHGPNFFSLVRFRIQCCAPDAIQISVPVVSKEPLPPIEAQKWVEVVGKVDFRQVQGKHTTVVLVSRAQQVQKCNPDLNPYLQ